MTAVLSAYTSAERLRKLVGVSDSNDMLFETAVGCVADMRLLHRIEIVRDEYSAATVASRFSVDDAAVHSIQCRSAIACAVSEYEKSFKIKYLLNYGDCAHQVHCVHCA